MAEASLVRRVIRTQGQSYLSDLTVTLYIGILSSRHVWSSWKSFSLTFQCHIILQWGFIDVYMFPWFGLLNFFENREQCHGEHFLVCCVTLGKALYFSGPQWTGGHRCMACWSWISINVIKVECQRSAVPQLGKLWREWNNICCEEKTKGLEESRARARALPPLLETLMCIAAWYLREWGPWTVLCKGLGAAEVWR